jgi:hypothetical protein
MIIKQTTSYARKFLMVDSTSHVAGKTGLNGAVTVYLSKGAGAAGTPAANSGAGVTELDLANLPGVYQITLTSVDTNTPGDLAIHCTGAGADPTDFIDQVQVQIFPDLQLDVNGYAKPSSNIKQNQPTTLFFTMTVAGVPTPGLAVTGTKNFGSGFSSIAGAISDLGNGDYKCLLQASDTNAGSGMWRFIAAGADDRNIGFFTTP